MRTVNEGKMTAERERRESRLVESKQKREKIEFLALVRAGHFINPSQRIGVLQPLGRDPGAGAPPSEERFPRPFHTNCAILYPLLNTRGEAWDPPSSHSRHTAHRLNLAKRAKQGPSKGQAQGAAFNPFSAGATILFLPLLCLHSITPLSYSRLHFTFYTRRKCYPSSSCAGDSTLCSSPGFSCGPRQSKKKKNHAMRVHSFKIAMASEKPRPAQGTHLPDLAVRSLWAPIRTRVFA